MIDTKLMTFMSLCETKSYTKTAELLYVTQPSVTHHIKTLEKMYNIKLFTSNSKNFKLTPQGELLLNYARQLQAFDNEFERMLEASINANKTITFSVTPTAMHCFLKDILPTWSHHNKDLSFTIKEAPFEEIHESLTNGKIDFAIVDNNFTKKTFQAISLQKNKLILGVSPMHLLSEYKKVHFESLINERIILDPLDSGKRQLLENELKLKNHNLNDLKNTVEVGNPQLIIDLVINNEGIGIFYDSEIEQEIKSGKIVPIDLLEAKNSMDVSLVYNKNHLDSKTIESIALDMQKISKEVNYLRYSASFK